MKFSDLQIDVCFLYLIVELSFDLLGLFHSLLILAQINKSKVFGFCLVWIQRYENED